MDALTDAQLTLLVGSPIGGSVGLILLWRWLARQNLGVKTDNAASQAVESQLKFSKETMERATEAEQRATANYTLFRAADDRASLYSRELEGMRERVTLLEKKSKEDRNLISDLAKLIIQLDEKSRPFVERLIQDSGYPPL